MLKVFARLNVLFYHVWWPFKNITYSILVIGYEQFIIVQYYWYWFKHAIVIFIYWDSSPLICQFYYRKLIESSICSLLLFSVVAFDLLQNCFSSLVWMLYFSPSIHFISDKCKNRVSLTIQRHLPFGKSSLLYGVSDLRPPRVQHIQFNGSWYVSCHKRRDNSLHSGHRYGSSQWNTCTIQRSGSGWLRLY